jgi:hypothetical protein
MVRPVLRAQSIADCSYFQNRTGGSIAPVAWYLTSFFGVVTWYPITIPSPVLLARPATPDRAGHSSEAIYFATRKPLLDEVLLSGPLALCDSAPRLRRLLPAAELNRWNLGRQWC